MKSHRILSNLALTATVALTAVALNGCGGSNPGSSGGNPPGGTTPTSGAVSVYVIQNPTTFGSGSGSILQFSATAAGSSSPTSAITAPTDTSFGGLATDGAGNIYTGGNSPAGADLRVYSAGATGTATPARLLPGNTATMSNPTTMIGAVDGIAASSAGEIYISEDTGGVATFSATANGSVAPEDYILGASQTGGGLSTLVVANAVAVDASGNLYIVNEGAPGLAPIVVFGATATGNVAPTRTIGGTATLLNLVGGVATDSTGNLYATTQGTNGGSVLVFSPTATGNVAPVRTITGASTQLGTLWGIKVDSAGNIYVVSTDSTGTNPTILKFSSTATGNVAPTLSITSTAWTNPDNNVSIAVF